MRWTDVRRLYPDQWVIIEALEAWTEISRRILYRVTVVETCRDGSDALDRYRQLRRSHARRELYFVHTSNHELVVVDACGAAFVAESPFWMS